MPVDEEVCIAEEAYDLCEKKCRDRWGVLIMKTTVRSCLKVIERDNVCMRGKKFDPPSGQNIFNA